VPLLSKAARRKLQSRGGVICPRNFLFELATVSRDMPDRRSMYFLYRQKGQLFVGTVAKEGVCVDAMRQGRHLEAAVVSFGWLEEDRVVMELTLPNGMLACYAGAPDAAVGEAVPGESLVPGDEAGYATAGYELSEVHDGAMGGEVRVWRAAGASFARNFLEVKKTTHLRGAAGDQKRAKYWMQATLGACASVLVATTADSHDGHTASLTQYTLDELEATLPNPADMWSDLVQHLGDIMKATREDGAWTLIVSKSKRRRESVTLEVKPDWRGFDRLQDTTHISRALDALASCGADASQEHVRWEMECGRGWSTWTPEGLDFEGLPGEVLHFKVAGSDYRAVFGPGDCEGFQENLGSGRRRKLRRAASDLCVASTEAQAS